MYNTYASQFMLKVIFTIPLGEVAIHGPFVV